MERSKKGKKGCFGFEVYRVVKVRKKDTLVDVVGRGRGRELEVVGVSPAV